MPGYIWEAVFEDQNGNWQDKEGEENTLEQAQSIIVKLLLKAGYKAIDNRVRVLE